MTSGKQFTILVPVYNDWACLDALLRNIDATISALDVRAAVLLVDDASTQAAGDALQRVGELKHLRRVDILHLSSNLGHQRALAIGLAWWHRHRHDDGVIIMDGDGEDRPADLARLWQSYQRSPDRIYLARRDQRSEGWWFRIGYGLYRGLFRLFTGQGIRFGNFSLLPARFVRALVYRDGLWNHLAASILRSRLPLEMVPTTRGDRLDGQTKMNINALILHGLSAIAVYNDLVLLRTTLAALSLGALATAGIALVSMIRLFTELAIPGWASTVVASLAVIMVQSLFLCVVVLFLVLSNRSQHTFIPARDFADFVLEQETVHSL